MKELPQWDKGDTLRSIKDVTALGILSVQKCLLDAHHWVDITLAEKILEAAEIEEEL